MREENKTKQVKASCDLALIFGARQDDTYLCTGQDTKTFHKGFKNKLQVKTL